MEIPLQRWRPLWRARLEGTSRTKWPPTSWGASWRKPGTRRKPPATHLQPEHGAFRFASLLRLKQDRLDLRETIWTFCNLYREPDKSATVCAIESWRENRRTGTWQKLLAVVKACITRYSPATERAASELATSITCRNDKLGQSTARTSVLYSWTDELWCYISLGAYRPCQLHEWVCKRDIKLASE